MALAVPSGSRATAAMKKSVTAAVATPRPTAAPHAARPSRARHGRARSSMMAPAKTRRSQAAPSAPTRSIRVTETARPVWTQTMAAMAMRAPWRERSGTAYESCTASSKTGETLRVHVDLPHPPFTDREQ